MQQYKVDLMINYTDEEISNMSKDKFRTIVNRSVDNFALAHLNTVASGQSKSQNLIKHRFVKESYFEDQRFSKSDSELLLALRTRMVKDIGREIFQHSTTTTTLRVISVKFRLIAKNTY